MYKLEVEVIHTIPNLKPSLERINKYLSTEDKINLTELSELIKVDPVLTTKILKLANSPIFGFSYKVDSIDRALMLIGLNLLKIMLFSLMIEPTKEINGLWEHSLTTAIYTKVLAEICIENKVCMFTKEGVEELYTCALIHDIGKIILLTIFKEEYIEKVCKTPTIDSSTLEETYFYYDHSIIGSEICKKWRLPSRITRLIEHHHKPHKCTDYFYEGSILHVADVLSLLRGIDKYRFEANLVVHPFAWNLLRLSETTIISILERAEPEIQRLEGVLLDS